MSYMISIKTAIFAFPIIAFIFTIPFILHQYHKYGSINKLRVLIIYSFILYMITIYFLVILPLPSRDSVAFKEGMVRLIPFGFVRDFMRESSFILSDPSTYLKALKEPCFYTVFLNILMFVPFGMYLRYYFKCDFKNTTLYSFFLSLFFEVTQLTGLYFIYKYPYRIFDVDDLIINTLGGIIGYFIMGLFIKILPSRERIDKEALEEGKKVSGLRRVTLYCLDFFIYIAVTLFLSLLIKHESLKYLTFAIYYVLVPYFLNGKTLAGKFLNVKLEYDGNVLFNSTIRAIFLYIYYFALPVLVVLLGNYLMDLFNFGTSIRICLLFLVIFGTFVLYLVNIFRILTKKEIFYDKLFKVKYVSTIETDSERKD